MHNDEIPLEIFIGGSMPSTWPSPTQMFSTARSFSTWSDPTTWTASVWSTLFAWLVTPENILSDGLSNKSILGIIDLHNRDYYSYYSVTQNPDSLGNELSYSREL